jgi:hypothetical protein
MAGTIIKVKQLLEMEYFVMLELPGGVMKQRLKC